MADVGNWVSSNGLIHLLNKLHNVENHEARVY